MLASTVKNTHNRQESSHENDIATAKAPSQRTATATPGRHSQRFAVENDVSQCFRCQEQMQCIYAFARTDCRGSVWKRHRLNQDHPSQSGETGVIPAQPQAWMADKYKLKR